MTTRRVIAVATLATALATAFLTGRATATHRADPPRVALPGHRNLRLRPGDEITIPVVAQTCVVSGEGGAPDFVCARGRDPRHQVVFFIDSVAVWTAGNPDKPAWSGKP